MSLVRIRVTNVVKQLFCVCVLGLDSDESYEGTSEASFKDAVVYDGTQGNNGSVPQENGIRKHRTTLPAPMFSRNNFSVWGILKKCIGLELSKITMPIVFNEPLSFLQRITEYMEHTYLINKACSLSNSIERMQAVAAFAVSAVASQWDRTGKPFNPLLGETYELIREDQGFRLISEQVSHHPPISAFHAESLTGDFVFHGSIYPKLKFWGKSVEAEPKGTITLELLKHGEVYTWTNPFCCVHNVILGKLWIEQYGTVEILNHSTGDKCVLNFKPCGMFGKELHKVEGYIQDKSKKKRCVIYGKWTECMWSVDPQAYESNRKAEKKGELKKLKSQVTEDRCKSEADNDDADDMPEVQETVAVIPGSTLLWRISSRPQHSATMYNFTNFAMSLNELEPGMLATLAPTDCRLRPDIRAMENGDMDEASREKERLEEKQRSARKHRSKEEEEWSTRWFQSGTNPFTSSQDWLYTGGYFDRNYSDLPDIY
uniref:Oxysterol-binding protein n=1 Tax=Esox lucius TaxID=8010 RepID=A0A6Q2XWD3_ESOLU